MEVVDGSFFYTILGLGPIFDFFKVKRVNILVIWSVFKVKCYNFGYLLYNFVCLSVTKIKRVKISVIWSVFNVKKCYNFGFIVF